MFEEHNHKTYFIVGETRNETSFNFGCAF